MRSKQKLVAVLAICFAILLSAGIIAYRPWDQEEGEDLFKYPAGVPSSFGMVTYPQAGEDTPGTIRVSGSGSSSAKATQASLTLGVRTENASADVAVDENAERMNTVLDALEDLGIPEEDIETVSYSVYPQYDYERRETTGYRVVNMVEVTVKDIDLIGEVIDSTTGAGANQIQGISFTLSDEDIANLREEAYVKALQDAENKAGLIADTLELEITGVSSVTENTYQPYTPYRGMDVAEVSGKAPTPIVEGSLSVSVTVQVAFTFQ